MSFNIQQIKDAGPVVDLLDKKLFESNEKVKTLCETVSTLELRLKDVYKKLELSVQKCNQLSIENERLHGIENDLSKQVCIYVYNVI